MFVFRPKKPKPRKPKKILNEDAKAKDQRIFWSSTKNVLSSFLIFLASVINLTPTKARNKFPAIFAKSEMSGKIRNESSKARKAAIPDTKAKIRLILTVTFH